MIKTPKFWFKNGKVLPTLLSVFSKAYVGLTWVKARTTKPVKISTPVICVGNATLGGSGKTPTALALGKVLKTLGYSYGFLTRGYKGNTRGPFKVNASYHTAQQMGDEALILATQATTYVAKNRVKGGQKMDELGLKALVLDDGYQNPSLTKDLSILVIDGKRGFGNGYTFPAGPLRESADSALNKADAIVLIGDANSDVSAVLDNVNVPIFKASVQSYFPSEISKDTKLVAFAGLAFPNKFFQSLEEAGYNMVQKIPYPDHYLYSEKDFAKLYGNARSIGAKLITTEKDFVRLSKTQKKYVSYVPIELKWDNEGAIKDFLKARIP